MNARNVGPSATSNRSAIHDNSAVSSVISFVFAFGLSALILIMSFNSLSTVRETVRVQAVENEMSDVANRIAAGINIAVDVYRSNPNATYSRAISVPAQIGGFQYYVSISSSAVYANTTDGLVHKSSTTYNADEEGVQITGIAHSGAGYVVITLYGTQAKIELSEYGS